MTKQLKDFRFTVDSEAKASLHDDGIVILHLGSGRMYTSNQMGANIWRGIEQQRSLEAITDEISAKYGVARCVSHEHVVHFLAELERHTLVQREALS